MAQNQNQNIYTDTQTIFMLIYCLNFFQWVDLNGYTIISLTWISIFAIVKRAVFSKLILNILKN